ncbi:MAG: polysaccharide biosynthesis protein [Bacteroidales bacterium]|nr:polysaccharide biosynthesis protein [Bacteroidales bacterium]
MKEVLFNFIKRRVISPWWILLIDLAIVSNSFLLTFVLWLGFKDNTYSIWEFVLMDFWVVFVYALAYLITDSYRGVIRHSNYSEFKTLLIACFSAFITIICIGYLMQYYGIPWWQIPMQVVVFHFLLTAVFSFSFRILVKETYTYLTKKPSNVNTLIYGAGDMGQITLEAIRNDKNNRFQVISFIDDNPAKWNKSVHSIPVKSWDKVKNNSNIKNIKVVVLAINDISITRKKEITSDCLKIGWKLKVMPTVANWVNGISNTNQIRDIRIEDILGRKEIKLNLKRISTGLEGKIIMVTGAAGSIGSEIVRNLLRFPVKKILLIDIAESALYNLQQELLLSYNDVPFELILVDYTNSYKMRKIFEEHRPQIVYNAAAYKHVPIIENNPYEAIRVNIGGVKLMADLSVEFGVEKFVMISTDKAVNPTNVMGASKRLCEIYIQSLVQRSDVETSFITTRFGNVLGSNGSVIPLFKKQITLGGPITVTDPEITRFFMTIPEACQLVLEAGFIGNGGEIFVFDMGEPVKILELAEGMIQLAGLKSGVDIDIKITGLRPGEKLYEELIADKEDNLPTHNEKIMIARNQQFDYITINEAISELLKMKDIEDDWLLVARIKDIIPEYISNNSNYSVLDKSN